MKTKIQLFLITLLIACLEPSHNAHAVTPPPDGGYSGGNTAEGDNALLGLTSGSYDTALGFRSLQKNTEATSTQRSARQHCSSTPRQLKIRLLALERF